MNKTSGYSNQSETDQIFRALDSLGQAAEIGNPFTVDHPVLTMSSLGRLGRFGNQLFQYAFLRICAHQSGAQVECPSWIGQSLFGHSDSPISHYLPSAIEQLDQGETLFDVMPEFIAYIEKMAGAPSVRVNAEALEEGLSNVDLWGFFQVNTRLLQPHQAFFRSLFQPVPDLKSVLETGLTQLRSRGKTIIGLHIRRGDFVRLPLAGFTLLVPLEWWCEWLDRLWCELDQPVLFLCSDELERVLSAFAKFAPITCNELSIALPEQLQAMNAEFYIDFFMLSQCDVVGISNSIFSFAACLLNERGQQFFRPCWDFSTKFVKFDPWDSLPLLYIGGQPKLSKRLDEVISVALATQCKIGLLKCLCLQVPIEYIRRWLVRVYLRYQVAGLRGVFRSFN